MFEKNVTMYPIDSLQISMCNWLTFFSNIILAKDDMLCYCNVLPTYDRCYWIFFLGYFNIILEHPLALGEVSRLG